MAKIITTSNSHALISLTFLTLLGFPVVSPALPAVRDALNISTENIGWVMSIYSLPALIFMPLTGYLADRYGKKRVIIPSLILFSVAGGGAAFADNMESLLLLRFVQGIGASALSNLNVALVGDMFKGKDRATMMGYIGATQNIGSGILPIIGGVLASFAWFYPFAVPVVGLPIGLYLVYVLDNDTPDKTSGTKEFLGHAWRHLNDRRVIELIAMTGCFIFIGFGLYVTYLPLFMKDNLAASSFLIGVVLSSRSISGAIMAAQLGRLTTIFSYRTLIVFSFAILGVGLALVPFAESFWVLIVATTCYGAGFGIARPSLQVILLDIAPDNLRATFASASGLSLRMAQFIAPILAGSVLIFRDYTDLYIGGAGLAFGFAALAYFAKSLRPEKN